MKVFRNLLIITTLFFIGGYLFMQKAVRAPQELPKEEIKEIIPVVPKKPITLLFVGDIMSDRGVRRSVVKNLEGDYSRLFSNIPEIGVVDIAFANLEGPVADTTTGKRKGSIYSFRMDPKTVEALSFAGFDVVSFANNHVGDYGIPAFIETMRLLREKNIAYAGTGMNYVEAVRPTVFNVRGMRIGFLAFSDVGPVWMKAEEDTPGQLLYEKGESERIVAEAKKEVDILFVSMHFGDEYSPASEHQEMIARSLVDAGADGIVGHHAHVMQKIEWYKDRPIMYGLGNFIFDQYFSPYTLQGMVVLIEIDPDTKKITLSPYVTKLSDTFVPGPLIPFDESVLITKPFRP